MNPREYVAKTIRKRSMTADIAAIEDFWRKVCERANEIRRNRPHRGEWDVIPYGQAATEIIAEMRRGSE